MWCKSLTLEKYISFRIKWFFSPPFLSVTPFLLLNLVRRQCYAYAIGLYTRPEIKSWPDVKFCAHAQCVLPRCWFIQWIALSTFWTTGVLVDSAIQRLNNWNHKDTCMMRKGVKRSYPVFCLFVCLFLFSTLNVLEPRQKDLYGKMHFSIYVSSSRLYSFADCLDVMEGRKLKPTWGVNEEPFAFEYIGTSIRESPLGPRKVSPEWRLGWDLLIINQQRKYF